jgi:hypothetical protein
MSHSSSNSSTSKILRQPNAPPSPKDQAHFPAPFTKVFSDSDLDIDSVLDQAESNVLMARQGNMLCFVCISN